MNGSLVDGLNLNQTAATERNGLAAARKSQQIASVFLDKLVVPYKKPVELCGW